MIIVQNLLLFDLEWPLGAEFFRMRWFFHQLESLFFFCQEMDFTPAMKIIHFLWKTSAFPSSSVISEFFLFLIGVWSSWKVSAVSLLVFIGCWLRVLTIRSRRICVQLARNPFPIVFQKEPIDNILFHVPLSTASKMTFIIIYLFRFNQPIDASNFQFTG